MRRTRLSIRRRLILTAGLFVLAGLTAAVAVPQARWRAHVLLLHLSGEIPDIELEQLIAYMLPGSEQTMTWLIERRNPYAVIRNFRTSAKDIEAGAQLYRERCASCHGPDGSGGPLAPSLTGREFEHGDSDWAVFRTIRHGVANTTMQPIGNSSETEIWQLISFLRYIDVPGDHDNLSEPALRARISVPFAELAGVRNPADDWLTYSGSYYGTRHSTLSQIDRTNVDALALGWIHQFDDEPALEATPLVRDGVMFMSVPPCSVSALNAVNGREIWSWSCESLTDLAGESGVVNRGVALLGDNVFVATRDARLFALDATTGRELWEATVEEDYGIYYITGAPVAYKDLVVTGISTREVGRGLLAAFDAQTGEERWRFHTVPAPGEPGNETWAGDSWRVGGGPTWLQGSYDPERDLLYWGVGNPKPDYDKAVREGDNLYTNSVIALRGQTGELIWHFQFVPGDDKDWGANQIPVLIDRPGEDSVDKLMLWANRNGFYYVLDRYSGAFLKGTPFVYQNWTAGLDSSGRPIPLPPSERGDEGDLLYPGNVGGTHWSSPSYYPGLDLMIVPVLEQGMVYFPSFSSPPRASGRSFYTAVRALSASTGELAWEHKRPPRFVDNFMPGLLSTEGGLVFGSDQSTFFALDAESGELLWSLETGGKIIAAPMTYAVEHVQYVSLAAGRDLLTFSLPARITTVESGTSAIEIAAPLAGD